MLLLKARLAGFKICGERISKAYRLHVSLSGISMWGGAWEQGYSKFSSRDRLDNFSMTVVVSWIIVEMAHFLE